MNLGSLSKMMHLGMLNTLTICYRNRSATLGAVMLSCMGVRTTCLVALSTTVMIPLNPCDRQAKYKVHGIVTEQRSRRL